jgi:hypothetical protein
MGLQRISIATIGWINSSRSTEVPNVPTTSAVVSNGVSRKDVKYLVDPGQKKLQVVSYEKWGDRTNELVQTYNKLIMREGHCNRPFPSIAGTRIVMIELLCQTLLDPHLFLSQP